MRALAIFRPSAAALAAALALGLAALAFAQTGGDAAAQAGPYAAADDSAAANAAAEAEAEAAAYREAHRNDVRNGFLPGLSASLLKPFVGPKLYEGVNFHYAFIQGVSRAAGPADFGGYFEWYGEVGYYKELASAANDDIFFLYSIGVNLSFEKRMSARRAFLVPYFGLKAGGVYFNDRASGLLIEPVLGAVLLRLDALNANYDASVFLNTMALGEFIGLRHSLVVNFNL
jgi:hypothetical protein